MTDHLALYLEVLLLTTSLIPVLAFLWPSIRGERWLPFVIACGSIDCRDWIALSYVVQLGQLVVLFVVTYMCQTHSQVALLSCTIAIHCHIATDFDPCFCQCSSVGFVQDFLAQGASLRNRGFSMPLQGTAFYLESLKLGMECNLLAVSLVYCKGFLI